MDQEAERHHHEQAENNHRSDQHSQSMIHEGHKMQIDRRKYLASHLEKSNLQR